MWKYDRRWWARRTNQFPKKSSTVSAFTNMCYVNNLRGHTSVTWQESGINPVLPNGIQEYSRILEIKILCIEETEYCLKNLDYLTFFFCFLEISNFLEFLEHSWVLEHVEFPNFWKSVKSLKAPVFQFEKLHHLWDFILINFVTKNLRIV